MVRRLAIVGFLLSFVALALLPFFGRISGKRWLALRIRWVFASFQPSDFPQARLCGRSGVDDWRRVAEINAPRARTWSFALCIFILMLMLRYSRLLRQAFCVLSAGRDVYFVAGAPFWLLLVVWPPSLRTGGPPFAYVQFRTLCPPIRTASCRADIDPRTQAWLYATDAHPRRRFVRVGVARGQCEIGRCPMRITDFIIAVARQEYGLILSMMCVLSRFMPVDRCAGRCLPSVCASGIPSVRLAGTSCV